MKLRDLTGQKFHRLIAIRRVENLPGRGQARWLFRCDCGKEIVAFGYNIAHGRQKSCGCYVDDHPSHLRHGKSGTKVYHAWSAIRQRCENPNSKHYQHYGARGIRVCERWHAFEHFLADMGEPPSAGLTLERLDNDKDYEPGNCVWAGRTTQVRNRRKTNRYTYQGQTKSLADWAELFGLPYKTVWHRYAKMEWRGAKLFSPLGATSKYRSKAET